MPTNNTPRATSSTIAINGPALRLVRKLMGVGPRDLAEKINRDRTYIVKIENGGVDRVGVETFNSLCTALNIEDRRALMASPYAESAAVA